VPSFAENAHENFPLDTTDIAAYIKNKTVKRKLSCKSNRTGIIQITKASVHFSDEGIYSKKQPKSLVQSEAKAMGSVKSSTYISFIKAAGG